MQAADVDETGQPAPKAYRNMKKLEPPDTHYLRAAEGWVGLGDLVSAAHELKQISPALQVHPEVLMVRCDILADARKWDAFLVVAEVLFKVAPENPDSWLEYSFALHQVKRTEEAVDLLLPSVRKFPKYWTLTYNLACFTAQLGRLEEARQWLRKTTALRDPKKLKLLALSDRDLEPLWPEVARISVGTQPNPPTADPHSPARFAVPN